MRQLILINSLESLQTTIHFQDVLVAYNNFTSGGMFEISGPYDLDQVVFLNATFINNHFNTKGAFLLHFGAKISVHNSTFFRNSQRAQGAILIQEHSNTSSTFTNCSFEGNVAFQGAVLYSRNHGHAQFNYCVFRFNMASMASIGYLHENSSLHIYNSVFESNFAYSFSLLKIHNGYFESHIKSSKIHASGVASRLSLDTKALYDEVIGFVLPHSLSGQCAISLENARLQISDALITEHNSIAQLEWNSFLTINSHTKILNSSQADMHFFVHQSTVLIEDSVMSDLTFAGRGLRIYGETFMTSKFTLRNVNMSGLINMTIDASNAELRFESCAMLNLEMMILAHSGSQIVFKESQFLNISYYNNNPLLQFSKELVQVGGTSLPMSIEIDNCTFLNNLSPLMVFSYASVNIRRSVFTNPSGAMVSPNNFTYMFFDESDTNISGSIFRNIHLLYTQTLHFRSSRSTKLLTIQDTLFASLKNKNTGGALSIHGMFNTSLIYNVFEECESTEGGALQINCLGMPCHTSFSELSFMRNHAVKHGGAVYLRAPLPYLNQSTSYIDNSAPYGDDAATIPAQLELISHNNQSHPLQLASGQINNEHIRIGVLDAFGRLVSNLGYRVMEMRGVGNFTREANQVNVTRGGIADFFKIQFWGIELARFNISFSLQEISNSTEVANYYPKLFKSHSKVSVMAQIRKCHKGEALIVAEEYCYKCSVGEYSMNPGEGCKKCEQHSTCPDGILTLNEGYWRMNQSTMVVQCFDDQACLGGSLAKPDGDWTGNCSRIYHGNLCNRCRDVDGQPHHKLFTNECARCWGEGQEIGIISTVVLLYIGYIMIIIQMSLKEREEDAKLLGENQNFRIDTAVLLRIFTDYL